MRAGALPLQSGGTGPKTNAGNTLATTSGDTLRESCCKTRTANVGAACTAEQRRACGAALHTKAAARPLHCKFAPGSRTCARRARFVVEALASYRQLSKSELSFPGHLALYDVRCAVQVSSRRLVVSVNPSFRICT